MPDRDQRQRPVSRGADPVDRGERREHPVPERRRRPHRGGHVAEGPLPCPGATDARGDVEAPRLVPRVRHVRIVVATTFTSFSPGVADGPADALVAACRARGDDADRVRLPRGDHLAAACRLTDVGADRLLCLDARAALLVHPARRVWLLDPEGLDEEPVRAAVAAAPTVHVATEPVRVRLGAVGVPAALLSLPSDPTAWTRAVRTLVR
jgi:hypothetical protein